MTALRDPDARIGLQQPQIMTRVHVVPWGHVDIGDAEPLCHYATYDGKGLVDDKDWLDPLHVVEDLLRVGARIADIAAWDKERIAIGAFEGIFGEHVDGTFPSGALDLSAEASMREDVRSEAPTRETGDERAEELEMPLLQLCRRPQ